MRRQLRKRPRAEHGARRHQDTLPAGLVQPQGVQAPRGNSTHSRSPPDGSLTRVPGGNDCAMACRTASMRAATAVRSWRIAAACPVCSTRSASASSSTGDCPPTCRSFIWRNASVQRPPSSQPSRSPGASVLEKEIDYQPHFPFSPAAVVSSKRATSPPADNQG